MGNNKTVLNETQLRYLIGKTIKKTLREQDELSDEPWEYDGIDDYSDAKSKNELWQDFDEVYGKSHDYPADKYVDTLGEFEEEPEDTHDADYYLDDSPLNAFSRDDGGVHSMGALEDGAISNIFKNTEHYNGFKDDDPNNPSIVGDDDDTLNESKLKHIVKESIRKIVRESSYEIDDDKSMGLDTFAKQLDYEEGWDNVGTPHLFEIVEAIIEHGYYPTKKISIS